MTLSTVKRLAADIMGVGINRVRIKPEGVKDAEKAMTRADVRELISKKMVSKKEAKGRRHKELRAKRGPGGRKGTTKTRTGGKESWMEKVRAQRTFLFQLIADGALDKSHKRILYMRIKSGLFRSKKALLAYLKDAKMVKQDFEPQKKIPDWLLRKQAAKAAVKPVASPAKKTSVVKEANKS